MSQPQYPLFINPASKNGKSLFFRHWLKKRAHRFHCIYTRSEEDLMTQVKAYAQKGEPLIVVAGGDGTLNKAAQGLIGTQTALGILPIGTMNVLARELHYSLWRLDKTLELFDRGHICEMDIFTANGHPILQIMGVGLDAEAIKYTSPQLKKYLSGVSYVVQGFKRFQVSTPPLQITIPMQGDDNIHYETEFALLGNGRFYGGQMPLFGKASQTDGKLDLIMMRKNLLSLSKTLLYGFFPRLQEWNQDITYTQVEELIIDCAEPTPYEIDGDYMGETPVHIQKLPDKLRVICP